MLELWSSGDDNDNKTELSLLTSHLSLSLEGGSTGGHVLWPCVGGAKSSMCGHQRHLSEEDLIQHWKPPYCRLRVMARL